MENKISYLKSLQVIHNALLVGQLLFAGIGFYFAYNQTIKPISIPAEMYKPVLYTMMAVPGILVWSAFFIYRKKIAALENTEGTETEIQNRYRALSLIRWAMIEASTLLLIIGGILTSQKAFFAAALLVIVIFFLTRPTKDKMLAEAGLEDVES